MLLNFVPVVLKGSVSDYSKIHAMKQAGILDKPRPDYIPAIDLRFFANCRNRLAFVSTTNENEYLLFTSKESGVIVDLDQLAFTQDYLIKCRKEEERLKNEALKKKMLEKYGYESKARASRVMTLSFNKMSHYQFDLYRQQGFSREDSWKEYCRHSAELNQKLIDLELETLDAENTFSKGEVTSYGDTNLSTALLDRFGVRIKRQNGDQINKEETRELAEALEAVFEKFGDLSPVCREYGLKISHSAEKRMHARRTCGIFFPYFKAIGVGYIEMKETLSHEIAHFMDRYAGEREAVKRSYSSDNPEGIANKIAKTFRRNLNRRSSSNYINRTCECFARAFEQYFCPAIGEKEIYCKPEAFEKEVAPLVRSFLADFAQIVAEVKAEQTPEVLPEELKPAAKIDAPELPAEPVKMQKPEPYKKPVQLTLF